MNKADLLKKYFHGQCTPLEKKYLFDHLRSEEVEDYQEVMKSLWEEFSEYPVVDSSVSERMYQNIIEKANIRSSGALSEKRKGKQMFFTWYRLAAVFIGFLILSAVAFRLFQNFGMEVHSTAFGEQKVVVLPDSSVITLNANSSLSYAENSFLEKDREVWVTGEAYFDIRKREVGNEKSRFTVHTGVLSVEVLGTRFNVNTGRETTEVVLESGKVQLNITDDEEKIILMQPGDLVAYSDKDKRLEHKIVLPEEYSAWRSNKLVFNGVTIEHIARKIEETFGYKVVLEDSALRSKQYRGTFPTDNPDIFLKSLSRSFGLEVIKGKEVIIFRKKSPGTN